MNHIGVRIKKLIEFTGLSDTAFAKTIDTPQTTFSNMLTRNSIPKADLLQSIVEKYKVTPEWLLTGTGKMFREDEKNDLPVIGENEVEKLANQDNPLAIPYFDIDVMAHISMALEDLTQIPSSYLVIPGFTDSYACFPVHGDSMEPKISSGDIIAISRPLQSKSFLWGEIHMVVTNEWRVIKTVHPGKTEEYIVLRSINPKFAGDTQLHKDDIVAMYLVKGVVSRLVM